MKRGQGHRRRVEARRRAAGEATQASVEMSSMPARRPGQDRRERSLRRGNGRGRATVDRAADSWGQ